MSLLFPSSLAVASTVDLQQHFSNQAPPRDHFISVLEHWAEHRSDDTAYLFTDVESVEQKLSYAELLAEVRGLAGYMQKPMSDTQRRSCFAFVSTRIRFCHWFLRMSCDRGDRGARVSATTKSQSFTNSQHRGRRQCQVGIVDCGRRRTTSG